MKANNSSGNIPVRDEWRTPKDFWDTLDKQYNFMIDCCATKENSLCPLFCDNFLSKYNLNYICWMNPPFSKAKNMFIHFFKVVEHGIAIYRCDNFETSIWQDLIFPNCDWVFIPKGRVVYNGLNGNGSRFPSALIGIGVDCPKYLDGVCLKLD